MEFLVNFDNNTFYGKSKLETNKNKFIEEAIKTLGNEHAYLKNDNFYISIDTFEDIAVIENIVGDIRKDKNKFLYSFSPKFNVISVEFNEMWNHE